MEYESAKVPLPISLLSNAIIEGGQVVIESQTPDEVIFAAEAQLYRNVRRGIENPTNPLLQNVPITNIFHTLAAYNYTFRDHPLLPLVDQLARQGSPDQLIWNSSADNPLDSFIPWHILTLRYDLNMSWEQVGENLSERFGITTDVASISDTAAGMLVLLGQMTLHTTRIDEMGLGQISDNAAKLRSYRNRTLDKRSTSGDLIGSTRENSVLVQILANERISGVATMAHERILAYSVTAEPNDPLYFWGGEASPVAFSSEFRNGAREALSGKAEFRSPYRINQYSIVKGESHPVYSGRQVNFFQEYNYRWELLLETYLRDLSQHQGLVDFPVVLQEAVSFIELKFRGRKYLAEDELRPAATSIVRLIETAASIYFGRSIISPNQDQEVSEFIVAVIEGSDSQVLEQQSRSDFNRAFAEGYWARLREGDINVNWIYNQYFEAHPNLSDSDKRNYKTYTEFAKLELLALLTILYPKLAAEAGIHYVGAEVDTGPGAKAHAIINVSGLREYKVSISQARVADKLEEFVDGLRLTQDGNGPSHPYLEEAAATRLAMRQALLNSHLRTLDRYRLLASSGEDLEEFIQLHGEVVQILKSKVLIRGIVNRTEIKNAIVNPARHLSINLEQNAGTVDLPNVLQEYTRFKSAIAGLNGQYANIDTEGLLAQATQSLEQYMRIDAYGSTLPTLRPFFQHLKMASINGLVTEFVRRGLAQRRIRPNKDVLEKLVLDIQTRMILRLRAYAIQDKQRKKNDFREIIDFLLGSLNTSFEQYL